MGGWIFFVPGTIAGSVANAVIYRLPRRISWWKGKSFCPQCKHPLAWYDLVPLLSYLILRGKCRYCHKLVSWRYFLVELMMAFGFVILSHSWSLIVIYWITVVIAVMDWETMLVSEWLVGLWFVLTIFNIHPPMAREAFSVFSFYGLLAGIAVIGGIWAISRGKAMGFGDVEIAAVLGLWLGWPKIGVALWLAFIIGAAVGVLYLALRIKHLKSRIAFGPFLILGGWLAYLVQWKYVLPF